MEPKIKQKNIRGSITAIDKLIHEPARLIIIANLYVLESSDFLFLMRQTGLTFGNLSSHLSKLEKGNYTVSYKPTFYNPH